jgi:hypothetical protein
MIYVRHARTDSTQEETDLASCATQRILSQQGRNDAIEIGVVWVTMAVPVGVLMSTEYLRTHETAPLAFGEPNGVAKEEIESALET